MIVRFAYRHCLSTTATEGLAVSVYMKPAIIAKADTESQTYPYPQNRLTSLFRHRCHIRTHRRIVTMGQRTGQFTINVVESALQSLIEGRVLTTGLRIGSRIGDRLLGMRDRSTERQQPFRFRADTPKQSICVLQVFQ